MEAPSHVKPVTFFKHRILTSPTSPKSIANDLQHYEKSCTRTEMPSKYKIVTIPKMKIEDVYTKRTPTNRDEPTEGRRGSASPGTTDRAFYYSEKNEILSVDEFLHVHKKLGSFRHRQEKVMIKTALDDKASKIEEVRRSQIHPPDLVVTSKTEDSAIVKEIQSTTRPMTTQNIKRSMVESIRLSPTASFLNKDELFRGSSTTLRQGVNKPGMAHRSASMQRLTSKQTERKKETLDQQKTIDNTEAKPAMQKSMALEQKFTAKEINKHLFHLTISPRRPKMFPLAINKELNYCKMFSTPKVMDLAVESCIRKGKKLEAELNIETDPEKKYELGVSSARSITKEDEFEIDKNMFMTTFITQTGPQTARLYRNRLGIEIEQRIKNIDTVLKRSGMVSPIPESGPEGIKKPKQITVRTKNKVPLRSSFKNSYHIKEIIQEHKNLAAKIKNLNTFYQKEYGASSMNSQTYASYYH